MEFIRMKYGAEKPNALLSRGIAGITGKSLIYTLPGSVRAVDEYMTEILKDIEAYCVNAVWDRLPTRNTNPSAG